MNDGLKNSLMSPQFLVNLTVLVVGLGVLWGAQGSKIEYMQHQISAAEARIDIYEKALNGDRTALTNRLTGLEADTKYISQTLQELKLAIRAGAK